jgi:hypothetical protein
VAKDIGDQLETGAASMGVSRPSVPQDVSSMSGNPASLKGTANHVSYTPRT